MKLGEALYRRNELKKSILPIERRIKDNLIVQEGEKPVQDPIQLIQQLETVHTEINILSKKIYHTNDLVMDRDDGDGESLSQLLTRKNLLKKKISHYSKFINKAWETRRSVDHNRDIGAEEKERLEDRARGLKVQRTQLETELGKLDFKIQALNWGNDLIDT